VGGTELTLPIYRAAFEACSDAAFIVDGRGRYIAANERATALTGYDRPALRGMARGDLLDAKGHLRRRDGSLIPVEIQVCTLPDAHQLEIIRDISSRKAYESLLESEAKYRALVESIRDPMFIRDAKGRYLYVNAAGAAVMGTTPDRVIGKSVADFFPPQLAEALVDEARGVIETGRDHLVEHRVDIDGQQTKWFNTIVQPVRNRDGHIVAVQGVVRDLTERRQMEDALRQSEERLRQAVRVANIGIFDHDHRTDAMYWSPELRAIHGVGSDEPLAYERRPDGLPAKAELAHPDDRARVNAALLRAHDPSSDGLFDVEYRVRHRDGGYRWLTVRSQTLFEGVGTARRPVRTIGAVRDITSVKQAEQALAENEERLQQVIDVSRIGVFEHDHLAGTMYLSSSMREFIGVGQKEAISGTRYVPVADSPPKFLQTVHPDDRERVAAKIARVHEEGGIYDDEHRLVRRDGSIVWVSTRAHTTVDGEGNARRPLRTVGAMVNITERKQAEEERQRLQLQLVQAQRMESIGRLAGGIAHDFNNMLNVICGYAELVVEQLGPGHPLHKAVAGIRNAGRRSSELTERLLTFARLQAAAPRVVDLNDCIEKSLDIVRRLIGENVQLVWTPDRDLWRVHVDPGQIDQVLMNLAANSRDAIDMTGHLSFRTANVVLDAAGCARHPGAVPGDYVMLQIVDDGQGMDEETRRHIFEPFYTTKPEGRGTGLGLAMVYGIVKQHGGHITVMSEPSKGTTITVLLPRCAGEPSAAVTPVQVLSLTKGSETVLLVEDEPMVLELGRHMLEDLGYTVLPVGSPGEAMRVAGARGDEIDLLVTDVVMPEMNGPELARRLLAAHPHLRCLFVSGYFPDSTAVRSAQADGIDFLQKPFSSADLADRVRRALDPT
jgi:two-component system, cell cycle sensor histidine kinase and response regulator CckA